MEIEAQLKNARIVPRRARAVRSLVLGLPVQEAHAQLMFESSKAAELVDKVIKSATANAKENFGIEENNLLVANVEVGEGVKFKRFRPVAKGMAHRYTKKTCHIRVVLKEIEKGTGTKKKKETKVQTLSLTDFEKMSTDKDGVDRGRSKKGEPKEERAEEKNKPLVKGSKDQGRMHRRKAI